MAVILGVRCVQGKVPAHAGDCLRRGCTSLAAARQLERRRLLADHLYRRQSLHTRRRRTARARHDLSDGLPRGAGCRRHRRRALPPGRPVPGRCGRRQAGSGITMSRQARCTSPAPGRRTARYPPVRTDCNTSPCGTAGIRARAIWSSPTTAQRCVPAPLGIARRRATSMLSRRWAVRPKPCPRGGGTRHRPRAINRRGAVLARVVRQHAVRGPGVAGTVMHICRPR